MKEFHPEYLIVNRAGTKVGYLLRDAQGGMLNKASRSAARPLKRLNWDEFSQYVKDRRVQLFEMNEEGRPVPHYDEEELKAMRKVSRKLQPLDEETYYNSEGVLYDDCVEVSGSISIGLVCCRTAALVKSTILQGCVYAPGCTDSFVTFLKKNSLLCSQMAADSFICNWDKRFLEEIVKSYDAPVSVCARSMRHIDNSIYRAKMMGMTPVGQKDADYYADLFEAMPRYCGNGVDPKPTGSSGASGVQRMKLQ